MVWRFGGGSSTMAANTHQSLDMSRGVTSHQYRLREPLRSRCCLIRVSTPYLPLSLGALVSRCPTASQHPSLQQFSCQRWPDFTFLVVHDTEHDFTTNRGQQHGATDRVQELSCFECRLALAKLTAQYLNGYEILSEKYIIQILPMPGCDTM